MSTRAVTRFFSAFLFAIIIVVVAHFVLWFVSAHQAERMLVETLTRMEGVDISNGLITRSGYPYKIDLTVHDMKVKWQQPDGRGMQYMPGTVNVSTEIFDHNKITIALPKEQTLQIVNGHNAARTYDVLMEGGRVTYFDKGYQKDLTLNVDALTLMDTTDGQRNAVLKSGSCYLVRTEPGQRAPADWRFALNNTAIDPILLGRPVNIDRLIADFGILQQNPMPDGALFATATAGNATERWRAIDALLADMAKSRVSLAVNDFQSQVGDLELTMRGDLGLADDLNPKGDLSVTTNKIGVLLDYLSRNSRNLDETLLARRQLMRSFGKDTEQNIGLSLEQGDVMVNGLMMGKTQPVPTLLHAGY